MATKNKKTYVLNIRSADVNDWIKSCTKKKSPSLYVEARCDAVVQQTEVIERRKAPCWDAKFLFFGSISSIISLLIKDHNWPFGGDICIGHVDISLVTLLARCANDAYASLDIESATVELENLKMGTITVKLGEEVDPADQARKSQEADDLITLGIGQFCRFQKLHQLDDIEASIHNLQNAAQLIRDGRQVKPWCLMALACSYQIRFQSLGELSDLDHAIVNQRKAVQLTDDNNLDEPTLLACLGELQMNRFERLGQLSDLQDAVWNLENALERINDENLTKPALLSTLGNAQQLRFKRLGQFSDLENAILNQTKAVYLTDDGNNGMRAYLSNLGASQIARFEQSGKLSDLANAISNLTKSVELTDDNNTDKAKALSNLGMIQGVRFKHTGQLADIENSISNLTKAVNLANDENAEKARFLSNLGGSQANRFERLGQLADLENSITNTWKAVLLTDDRHPQKPLYLSNLGQCQEYRFQHLGQLSDLENSISNQEMAVQLTDDEDSSKPISLSNLGMIQNRRFESLGQLSDLDNAISNLKHANRLVDDGNLNKPVYLSNLGNSQNTRFQFLDKPSDLASAISNLQKAVEFANDAYPHKALYLFNLGNCQETRFSQFRKPADHVAGVSSFKAAAQSSTAYPRHAFRAARRWAEMTHRTGNLPSALEGYRTSLEILPKIAWLGLDATSRHDWLRREKPENLGCLAATCAIQLGRFEEAVELLDLSRSVFWQQASSLRSDLETLREEKPQLAQKLENIGRKLDADNFSGTFSSVGGQMIGVHNTEDIGKDRRHLVGVWEGLVDEVRKLPKFKYFLKPVPFHQLRQVATAGQVVVINASEYGVDALIFGATGPIEHVSLPDINVETLTELSGNIILKRPENASATQQQTYTRRFLKPALRTVWNDILSHIFEKIQITLVCPDTAGFKLPRRRIWWYPTGPLTFIPIHAAGPGGRVNDVSRLVISSYVTTLESLYQAQKKLRQVSQGQRKFLSISQPQTPGQSHLPRTVGEVDGVVQLLCSSGWSKDDIVCLHGPEATMERVSDALEACSWAHFACHGSQDPVSGMNSAFALQDGCLELDQIASKRLSSGQFAFLSACHAASGLKDLPGEAMHLAAGLQFAGFPSVIATMWTILDKDAPTVTNHAYRYLCRNGLQGLDPSEAATALNYAILHLREDPKVTVDRWASFIHYGT